MIQENRNEKKELELTEQEMEGIAGGGSSDLENYELQEFYKDIANKHVKNLVNELKDPATSPKRKDEIMKEISMGSYHGIRFKTIASQIDGRLFRGF